MFSVNKILLIGICALGISAAAVQSASADHRNHYDRGHGYGYGHRPPVVVVGPRYGVPVYTQPQGVARPERFVCGADVFTGHYNCVKKNKAHFVRPMYHAPAPRHNYHPGW